MSDNRQPIKESGHWYRQDGSQLLTMPKVKGDGHKRVTLREARKLGDLAPGVTTILRCAASPQLDRWKQRQAIMSALTLPRLPDETEDAWLRRVEEDMGETARQAAAEGTRIHAAIEQALSDEPHAPEYAPHVAGVMRLLGELAGNGAQWVPERGVTHGYGFGTKSDAHDAEGRFCIDFKGKDGDQDALDKLKTYEQHHQQLAATRAALEAQDGATTASARNYDGPRRRCFIVYVSRTHPGACSAVEVTEKQLATGWECFKALLRYWQCKNNYRPDWAAR